MVNDLALEQLVGNPELDTYQKLIDVAFENRRHGTFDRRIGAYKEVLIEQEILGEQFFNKATTEIARLRGKGKTTVTAADVILDFPLREPEANEVLTDDPILYPEILKLANRKILGGSNGFDRTSVVQAEHELSHAEPLSDISDTEIRYGLEFWEDEVMGFGTRPFLLFSGRINLETCFKMNSPNCSSPTDDIDQRYIDLIKEKLD